MELEFESIRVPYEFEIAKHTALVINFWWGKTPPFLWRGGRFSKPCSEAQEYLVVEPMGQYSDLVIGC